MFTKLILFLKEKFRSSYYRLVKQKVVLIQNLPVLAGYKWIVSPIAGRAYYKGYYEPSVTKLLVDNLPPDGVFIDVGSHAGYFGLLASILMPLGQVYSFEPIVENYQFSRRIQLLNQIDHWLIENVVVGKQLGTVRFQTGKTTTMGRISDDGDLELPVQTLDNYSYTRKVKRIDLIKIDVEGFAGDVLAGAVDTIRNFKPKLVCELHNENEKEALLNALGNRYIYYHLDGTLIKDISKVYFDKVLAIPV